MPRIPDITVSIVHIEGPLKGEIQEFSGPEIRIGRHPGSHVRFPADLVIVSRDHARIIREGNRFKLINLSANYTHVGKKTLKENEEVYLKSGDWMMFAEGGPKVSFLTMVKEKGASEPALREPETGSHPAGPQSFENIPPQPEQQIQQSPLPKHHPQSHKDSHQPHPSQEMPLVVRYGPMLKQFKTLPVTIGRSSACDMVIDHPDVADRHAEIFYRQGAYRVRDLSGQHLVFIDGRSVDGEIPLQPGSRLSLGRRGPAFRFLGEGRLDEIDK